MSSSLRVFLLLYFRTMAEILEHRPNERDRLMGATLEVLRAGERTGQVA